MLQLDYMETDGRVVTQDYWEGHYGYVLQEFHNLVYSQDYQLVYLWMMDDDPEIDDRVILERWVSV